jgi:hypothetical protein
MHPFRTFGAHPQRLILDSFGRKAADYHGRRVAAQSSGTAFVLPPSCFLPLGWRAKGGDLIELRPGDQRLPVSNGAIPNDDAGDHGIDFFINSGGEGPNRILQFLFRSFL